MNQITLSLMKRIISIIAIVAGFHLAANAQTHLSAGIGYYGENVTNPGSVSIRWYRYRRQRSRPESARASRSGVIGKLGCDAESEPGRAVFLHSRIRA